MKKFILFSFFLILFISCEKPFEKTDEVMDEDKFVAVMTDFYLFKNINVSQTGGRRVDYNEMNGYILQKHNITVAEFKQSFGYYMLNEYTSEEIYEQIEEKLNQYLPEEERRKKEFEEIDGEFQLRPIK